MGKDNSVNVPTSSNKPIEGAEHPGVMEKEKNATKGMTSDAMKTSAIT